MGRRTCSSGKRRFKSYVAAMNSMRGAPIIPAAYRCPECKFWHVTRSPR